MVTPNAAELTAELEVKARELAQPLYIVTTPSWEPFVLDAIRDGMRAALESCAADSDNVCDACAGTGKPISGKPCMCGGSGKMSDAARYLREQVVAADVQKEIAELRAQADTRERCPPRERVWIENNLRRLLALHPQNAGFDSLFHFRESVGRQLERLDAACEHDAALPPPPERK